MMLRSESCRLSTSGDFSGNPKGPSAADAPVAARLRPSVQPTQPKPLFHIAGTRDVTIPFASQQDAIETARRVDGVTSKGKLTRI